MTKPVVAEERGEFAAVYALESLPSSSELGSSVQVDEEQFLLVGVGDRDVAVPTSYLP